MRLWITIAFACLCFTTSAHAQLGPGHFAAWDRHDGRAQPTRAVRHRVARSARHSPRRHVRRVHARRSAPVRRHPVDVVNPATAVAAVVRGAAGVPGEIASFLRTVSSQCGQVHVISTFRPGAHVAGTNRLSCHAAGQAVDYQTSNPSCALRVAQGVRLGHSIDYAHVNHFHVSNCAREMGARFAHGGGHRHGTRVASRHYHIRVASRARRRV